MVGRGKERERGRQKVERGAVSSALSSEKWAFSREWGDFLFRRLGPKEEEIGRSLWEPQGKGFPDVGISHFELCLPSQITNSMCAKEAH